MLISTHKKIANRLYDELGKEFQRYVSRHAFIEGNFKPDIDTSFTRSHYYEKAFHYVESAIQDVMTNRYSRKELGIKLGVIAHFIADFSITYHGSEKYRSKGKVEHFKYELRIDDLIKNLSVHYDDLYPSIYNDLTDVKECFEAYMVELQMVKARPREDLLRAMSNIYHLLKLLIEYYATDDIIDHSGLRVAIFTDTYFSYGSGMSNAIHRMVRYFETVGIPYVLIAPKYKDTTYDTKGLNHESLRSMRFSFSPITKLSLARKKKIRKDLDEFNPTVIQVMTVFNLGRYGLKYGLKNEIPVFTNFSTDIPRYFEYYKLGVSKKIVWNYLRNFYNKSFMTFTPSYETKQYLEENQINNVAVFSRGVDILEYNDSHNSEDLITQWNLKDKFVFLYVGRLSEKKDLSLLCSAYNTLHKKYKDSVQLIIVGSGPRQRKYKKMLPNDAIITGYVDDEKLRQIYSLCDVFTFPSSAETYPNVVLEAMASSKPVIAVNEGGVKDIVQDDYNGKLVPPRSPFEFYNVMETLLLNSERVRVLGENAKAFAETRSWEQVFYEVELYYKKAIK